MKKIDILLKKCIVKLTESSSYELNCKLKHNDYEQIKNKIDNLEKKYMNYSMLQSKVDYCINNHGRQTVITQ